MKLFKKLNKGYIPLFVSSNLKLLIKNLYGCIFYILVVNQFDLTNNESGLVRRVSRLLQYLRYAGTTPTGYLLPSLVVIPAPLSPCNFSSLTTRSNFLFAPLFQPPSQPFSFQCSPSIRPYDHAIPRR